MYTANSIESVNSSLRKVTKKGAFPNENAVREAFYLLYHFMLFIVLSNLEASSILLMNDIMSAPFPIPTLYQTLAKREIF